MSSETLSFSACENQSCMDIIIVDDTLNEQDETFNVTLERTLGLIENITLHPVDTVIEIIDDDGMFLLLCFNGKIILYTSLTSTSYSLFCPGIRLCAVSIM